MTHEQTETLITCLVIVAGMALVTYIHFRIKHKPSDNFTRCWKSFQELQRQINNASWAGLRVLHEQIIDFSENYAGKVDQELLSRYVRDLKAMHVRRAKDVRPVVKMPLRTAKGI